MRGRRAGVGIWLVLLFASTAGLAAAFPAILRLPRREPGSAPGLPRALFSHRAHGQLVCFTCHPATFPQSLSTFTHDDMQAGRFCGRCHDGGTAFAITGAACGRCHVATR